MQFYPQATPPFNGRQSVRMNYACIKKGYHPGPGKGERDSKREHFCRAWCGEKGRGKKWSRLEVAARSLAVLVSSFPLCRQRNPLNFHINRALRRVNGQAIPLLSFSVCNNF